MTYARNGRNINMNYLHFCNMHKTLTIICVIIIVYNYTYAKPIFSFSAENDKCPTLSDPDNGKVYIISDGRVAIFTCNDGFVTVGNSYLQCINGKWNSQPPKCQPS